MSDTDLQQMAHMPQVPGAKLKGVLGVAFLIKEKHIPFLPFSVPVCFL